MNRPSDICFVHPETQAGEVFLINASLESFERLSFTTKRLGVKPYDGNGDPVLSADWHPIFLLEEEILSLPDSLQNIRRKLVEAGTVLRNKSLIGF